MSLLCQSVTIFRADGTKQVVDHCSFFPKITEVTDHTGTWLKRSFTLILRGPRDVRPGDRVLEGTCADRPFEELIPNAFTVGYVKPFFWNGKVSHMEVGG